MEFRLQASLEAIPAEDWDGLVGDNNPFLSHAFLAGLERHGCIREDYGWQAQHLGLWEGERLLGAVPSYLKYNSHGEFVFDWSWAGAYERHGLDYYPKLLGAVPYSPVPGLRLLVGDGGQERRTLLREGLEQVTQALRLSSAHVNFADAADAAAFADSDWLARYDWQFHWHARGYRDFEDFLDTLLPKKRKNIRQERAQVTRAGVRCEIRHGDAMDDADWDFVYRCYQTTFEDKGNHAALTLPFFRHLGATLGRRVLAVLAYRGDTPIAMALCLRSRDTLYGRYWGALEHVPGLHFEACYYQGIDYCIAQGLARFEPGAQGEHKLARGFLPVRTHSYHWLADARFRQAIRAALVREAEVLENYHAELLRHSPYAVTA